MMLYCMETIDTLIASLTHLRHTALSGALSLRVVCAHAAAALRRNTHPAYKCLAFAVLDFVAEALVLDDTEKLAAYCSRENVTPRPEFSLNYFDDAMVHLQEQVDAALSGVEVCEATRELRPGSGGHSAALGFLLLAAHLQRQCAHARSDLAQLYVELFSEGKHVGGLMASTMRLLARDVLDDTLESDIYRVPMHYWSAFEDMPPLDVYRWCDADTVGDLACFVLFETLGGQTVSEARDWANAQSTSVYITLRHIVRIVVAPLLQRRLLNQLSESAHELPDINLTFEWSCAAVHCELQLEEIILKLTLVLSAEHPLEPPIFRSFLLREPDINSIKLYLTYQLRPYSTRLVFIFEYFEKRDVGERGKDVFRRNDRERAELAGVHYLLGPGTLLLRRFAFRAVPTVSQQVSHYVPGRAESQTVHFAVRIVDTPVQLSMSCQTQLSQLLKLLQLLLLDVREAELISAYSLLGGVASHTHIRDMKILHIIRDAPPKLHGLCALSPCVDHCYVAYHGSSTVGEVQIFDAVHLVCARRWHVRTYDSNSQMKEQLN
ncbi:unnamed protein product [Euphydryas editha]|uniref:Uncharacterized protein n=1 Tax=Euphydryas editha TaxID=104508 RepID=A0AAU9UW71_EUPED|nr:unnamed protein product [Euphydryas editha]